MALSLRATSPSRSTPCRPIGRSGRTVEETLATDAGIAPEIFDASCRHQYYPSPGGVDGTGALELVEMDPVFSNAPAARIRASAPRDACERSRPTRCSARPRSAGSLMLASS